MTELSIDQVNRLILNKHHLTKDSKIDDILTITNDICGLHGTGTIGPYLSLFVRMPHFDKKDLDNELYVNKTMGRIRGMRKTLFIETKDLIPIVHNLIRSQTQQRDDKYLEYTGISKTEYEIIAKQILTLLSERELSTSDIKKTLKSDKNIIAVISVMCDELLIIRGKPLKSWKDRRINYAPFNSYFPKIDFKKYNESEAIKLLVNKYIKSYGPVTEEDIAWWLGITKTKVKKVLTTMKSSLEVIKINGLSYEYFLFKNDLDFFKNSLEEANTSINVLPGLDPYVMGYKNRERYLDKKFYEYVFDRSGNGTTTILINGSIVGVWNLIEKPKPSIKIYTFEKIAQDVFQAIKIECQKVSKFLTGKNLDIEKCSKMTSLTKRTMGGFMSPLKGC